MASGWVVSSGSAVVPISVVSEEFSTEETASVLLSESAVSAADSEQPESTESDIAAAANNAVSFDLRLRCFFTVNFPF